MTNREFLEYLDDVFGILSRGVYLDRSAEEMANQVLRNQSAGIEGFETVKEDSYNDLYGLRTVSHPNIHPFAEWYKTGN